MVVMPDADIDVAVKGAVNGRFYNAGQVCTAVKRLYLHEAIAPVFIKKLAGAVEALRFGNGLDPDVRIGPLNNQAGQARIQSLVEQVKEKQEGTVAVTGKSGKDRHPDGYFYPPTLITDVPSTSPLLTEEVFGPVLPVVVVPDLDAAITSANTSPYGLGASVWTHDTRVISEFYSRIHAGIVWVNRHVSVPPEIPFGGTLASGTGRENGRYALFHYTQARTLYYGV
jgi:acyl-CoA reductase-like NAD-dependent aldehyde dehydrogenase